jgi:hypothetical protein
MRYWARLASPCSGACLAAQAAKKNAWARPALRRRVSSPDHVLGHAGLSDIDAELEELSMDPRRSAQRIGNAHLADKLAYLQRNRWPATQRF